MSAAKPASHLVGDDPAAASAKVLEDRRELALIAVERTRMPMVVSNPRLAGNPIVLANTAFLEAVGHAADDVIGLNWDFLHGSSTDPRQIALINEALARQIEITVELLSYRKDGSSFWNEMFISPVHDDEGALLYFFASSKDVSKRRQARELELEERRLLLEVDHRAKNALALVQGFVRLSRSDTTEAYAEAVQSRVDAIARAHTILALHGWRGVPLSALIDSEAERFDSRRVLASGPDVPVGSRQVQPLGLVLHELLSNAAKHGALATADGKVFINWSRADGDSIVIRWRETGGPAPEQGRPQNLGLILIEQTIQRQLAGRAMFDWKSTGLEAEFSITVR